MDRGKNMSIEISIKQKSLFKKQLPLDIMLGNEVNLSRMKDMANKYGTKL